MAVWYTHRAFATHSSVLRHNLELNLDHNLPLLYKVNSASTTTSACLAEVQTTNYRNRDHYEEEGATANSLGWDIAILTSRSSGLLQGPTMKTSADVLDLSLPCTRRDALASPSFAAQRSWWSQWRERLRTARWIKSHWLVETGSRKRQSGPCHGRGHSPVFMEVDQTLVPRSGALSRRDSTNNLRRITYCHRGTPSATSKTCKGTKLLCHPTRMRTN